MLRRLIRVSSEVRDRLAELARDRGASIGFIVGEYANATPTRREMAAKAAEAKQVLYEQSGYDASEEEEHASLAELQRRIDSPR